MSREKAKEELVDFSGTQFDPELVKIFISTLEKFDYRPGGKKTLVEIEISEPRASSSED